MSDDVSHTQVTSSTIDSENPELLGAVSGQDGVCRDYLRNVCRRGDRCRFLHPVDPTSARCDVIAQQSSRRGVVFCHDFQNAAGCRRGAACRYSMFVGLFDHVNKNDVLSQGEPRDAAVNLDTIEVYSGIARFSLRQHGFRTKNRNKKLGCCCDSRSYCVRHSGKLSNRFRLQVDERFVCTIRFNGYRVYERTQALSTQA